MCVRISGGTRRGGRGGGAGAHSRAARRQGARLCVHDERAAELAATGALPPGIAAHRLVRRRWVVRDTSAGPAGRLFWEQPFPFHSYHWGLLWSGLREATPASVVYRQGVTVTGVAVTADRAEVRLADGAAERYDLAVGADGYRSVVRETVCHTSRPEYAGYVCWRGNFDARRLEETGEADWPRDAVTTVCFEGGSCVVYRIPGPAGPRVNWVLYAMPPQSGRLRLDSPTSFPPGQVTAELAAALTELLERCFPPYWARVISLTDAEHTFVQPIYDLESAHTTAGRLLLAGDAAVVARPHTTSGAAKALQDASAFESAWHRSDSWDELLDAYRAARGSAGRELVALARRLGRAQVEQTPAWAVMDAGAAQAWWRKQLADAADIGGHAMSAPKPLRG
ncbi:monooxygenase [Streptomyces sp. A1136]|uniref:FAD binding domain-containing protein n=1 Tax=Streptomyces sp. A1136 TaxID=2563102 RepID=UPI00267D9DDA|nr:monooxygenase [Streptomyces sp. A1136]